MWTKPSSSAVKELNASLPETANILAVRPADWSDYPDFAQPGTNGIPDILPLEAGWQETNCQLCGLKCHLGVAQSIHLSVDPDAFVVLDFLCTSLVVHISEAEVEVRDLGGK